MNDAAPASTAFPPGSILALGFGTTVAMWGAAYLCRLPGVQAPSELLATLFVLCLLGGGVLAGRWLGGLQAGLRVGALASLLNLLILGSVLKQAQSFEGFAAPESAVRLHAGERVLGETKADARGHFQLSVSLRGVEGALRAEAQAPAPKAKAGEEAPAPLPWQAGADFEAGELGSEPLRPEAPPAAGEPPRVQRFVNHQGLAGVWLPATLAFGALLAALGAQLAPSPPPSRPVPTNWTSAFSRVAVFATLLLVGAGGLVTSNDAGLAVPDWPNSYTSNMFLYPLSRMTGGIYYEHTHRLFGSLVGLCTLVLAFLLWRREERSWVRRLGALAFVLVCVQGLMGGLRVTGHLTLSADAAELSPSLALALVHGVTGQLFFALLVGMSAIVSTTWLEHVLPEREAEAAAVGEETRSLAGWMVVLMVAQLTLGALVRHFHISVTLHVTGAVAVAILGGVVGVKAWGTHSEEPLLPRLGLSMLALVCLQFLLGVAALATTADESAFLARFQAPVTTLHQTCGALLLGAAVLLWVWTCRLFPDAGAKAAAEAPAEVL